MPSWVLPDGIFYGRGFKARVFAECGPLRVECVEIGAAGIEKRMLACEFEQSLFGNRIEVGIANLHCFASRCAKIPNEARQFAAGEGVAAWVCKHGNTACRLYRIYRLVKACPFSGNIRLAAPA